MPPFALNVSQKSHIGVGVTVGVAVGCNVGLGLGLAVGASVGLGLGVAVGSSVGLAVGKCVGTNVGLGLGLGAAQIAYNVICGVALITVPGL